MQSRVMIDREHFELRTEECDAARFKTVVLVPHAPDVFLMIVVPPANFGLSPLGSKS